MNRPVKRILYFLILVQTFMLSCSEIESQRCVLYQDFDYIVNKLKAAPNIDVSMYYESNDTRYMHRDIYAVYDVLVIVNNTEMHVSVVEFKKYSQLIEETEKNREIIFGGLVYDVYVNGIYGMFKYQFYNQEEVNILIHAFKSINTCEVQKAPYEFKFKLPTF